MSSRKQALTMQSKRNGTRLRHVLQASTAITVIGIMGLLSSEVFAQATDPLPFQAASAKAAKTFAPPPTTGTWTPLSGAHAYPGTFSDTALLLTNGTVLMHEGCTSKWYKLTPDNTGSYINGTWTAAASMQAGYAPLYFASQVLPDGRVIINGGEYNNCSAVWTTLGSLYDPVANTWTPVSPPAGWTTIGDAQSVIRADGHYMLADCCTTKEALATISGSTVTFSPTGTGKADVNDEEGWTFLPDSRILTVDANRDLGLTFNDSEIYSGGTWTAGPHTVGQLVDPPSHEVGPAPLLPNGLVFQIGGTTHTGVYNPATNTWTAGADIPGGTRTAADAPAAVLPSGKVLIQVSPGVFNPPSSFYEVNVKSPTVVKYAAVTPPGTAGGLPSFVSRMLVLPTGQILWTTSGTDVEIYTPKGNAKKAWRPVITSLAATITHGSVNNVVGGTGFNGLTQGGYYGDDATLDSNYPLVRITNKATHHVCYARTHDHATMGISTGGPTSTKFDVPAACELGASTLEVVANGIASKPAKAVTIN